MIGEHCLVVTNQTRVVVWKKMLLQKKLRSDCYTLIRQSQFHQTLLEWDYYQLYKLPHLKLNNEFTPQSQLKFRIILKF